MNLIWFVYLKVFKGFLFKVLALFEMLAHSSIEAQDMFCMINYIGRDFQCATASGSNSNLFLLILNPVLPSFT